MKLIKITFMAIIVATGTFTGCDNPGKNAWKTVTYTDDNQSWEPSAGLLQNQNMIMKKVITENTQLIEIEYKVPDPTFEKITTQSYHNEKTERCTLGNAWIQSDPGKPMIPYISSRIVLPFGQSIKNIKVTPLDKKVTRTKHLLGFGEIPQPISSKSVIRASADINIYQSDSRYPDKDQELFLLQDRCGVSVATISIYPLHYYPATRVVEYYKSFRLKIETKKATYKDSDHRNGIRIRKDRFINNTITEENPGTIDTYPDNLLEGAAYSPLTGTYEEYKYVVVTNASIINATTTPNLNDFITHKQSLGFTCKVKDITEIFSEYPGDKDSDKLRNFLRDAYNNWNTEYVLLGGDTNIIPLVTVLEGYYGGYSEEIPSDLPYQCLSQEIWNEDYEAEVYIGRASAENAEEFSNFVYKTIAYEITNSSDPYLKSVLNLGESLDGKTYSKPAMEAVENIFSSDFTFDGLYDSDVKWKPAQVVSEVNTNKHSIINHLGHSGTHYVIKLTTSEVFQNTKYIFAKSQGCTPGAFDRNCIGEQMTTSDRTGMWGVVFNSRFGWYVPGNVLKGSSQKVHMSFWHAYFNQNLNRVGQCNEYAHRINIVHRWDILESNLLGDPSVIISGGTSEKLYKLTVNESGQGSVSLTPPGGEYDQGTVVTLTATPDTDWKFSGWSGDLSGTISPTTITMVADKTVTASFIEDNGNQPEKINLTVINGSGSGTYKPGSGVWITRYPAFEGCIFTGWEMTNQDSCNGCNIDNPWQWKTIVYVGHADTEVEAKYIAYGTEGECSK